MQPEPSSIIQEKSLPAAVEPFLPHTNNQLGDLLGKSREAYNLSELGRSPGGDSLGADNVELAGDMGKTTTLSQTMKEKQYWIYWKSRTVMADG